MAVVRAHHYSVDDADYEESLKRRAAVIDAIRAGHPGLSKTLVKLEDGTYTDPWRWDSPTQLGAALGAAAPVAEVAPAMSLTKDRTAVDGEVIDERSPTSRWIVGRPSPAPRRRSLAEMRLIAVLTDEQLSPICTDW
jgi:hypothetical protein